VLQVETSPTLVVPPMLQLLILLVSEINFSVFLKKVAIKYWQSFLLY
jgi:hypothetical protein